MDWDKDPSGDNPFGGWSEKEEQKEPLYPEPPPEIPSKKELTNNLLDALVIAIDKGNKEEIEAIKEQLKKLK
jgi:hypothetical protein|tara:strand:+ start:43 stop:258 length:216 start_codon:yes stop_codon:yes gene_type:complete